MHLLEGNASVEMKVNQPFSIRGGFQSMNYKGNATVWLQFKRLRSPRQHSIISMTQQYVVKWFRSYCSEVQK